MVSQSFNVEAGTRRVIELELADRMVAQSVLKEDGWVSIMPVGSIREQKVEKPDALPDGMFNVTGWHRIDSPDIRDADLKPLAGLRFLRVIEARNTGITDAGVATLAGFPRLEDLDTSAISVTDVGVARLAALPKLRRLILVNTAVTGQAFTTFRPDSLTVLSIGASKCSDEGLDAIGHIESLEELYLGATAISDEGLKHLANLRHLRVLQIGPNSHITGSGMKYLTKLQSLRRLGLQRTTVGDAGLEHLVQLRLVSIGLGNTPITDAGLGTLAKVKTLRLLGVTGCRVSAAAVSDSQRQVPGCNVPGTFPKKVPPERPAVEVMPGARVHPVLVAKEYAHHNTGRLAYSADSKLLATGGSRGMVCVWDAETLQRRLFFNGNRSWVHGLAFSPDGIMIASVGVGKSEPILVWNARTGEVVRSMATENGAFRLRFSPDGKLLATGQNGVVRLYSVSEGWETASLHPSSFQIRGVAFSPDGTNLIAGSNNNPTTVALWDLAKLDSPQWSVNLPKSTIDEHWQWCPQDIRFDPSGKLIAALDGGRSIHILSATDGKEVRTLKGHKGVVWSLAFSPTDHLLASAASDGLLRLWDTTMWKTVAVLDTDGVVAAEAAFSPDGKRVACVMPSGALLVWKLKPKE